MDVPEPIAAVQPASPPPLRVLSRRTAWSTTACLLLLSFLAVALFVERPLLARPHQHGRERRAAFAIRDYVIPFQQWGTRAFTLPNLQSGYGTVDYVTLRSWGEDRSDEVASRIVKLLETHDAVDLFLLAHSNPFVDWVRKVPAELRRKLRLVYNTGCHDLRQKDLWLGLGARAYVGHVGLSESPVFYVYFLRRWLRGRTLDEAVAEANARTEAFLGSGLEGTLSNPQATVASTHAERAGDGALTIGAVP
ncbi:MAG TPA: hypothetical protein VF384_17970 [Planctomycetota bacterium]